MRARDKPDFPVADVDGTYGCRKCGTYARLKKGARLACSWCKSPLPLILVSDQRQGGAGLSTSK